MEPQYPQTVRSIAFALMKPDVVLREIVGEILDILDEKGFTIIDFRIGLLSDRMLQNMYARSFHWKVDSWFHNRRAFQYGPVVGIFLSHTSVVNEGWQNAQAFLSASKGHAIPSKQQGETIRARCHATSRVFNILHASDNIEDALIEASIWFGESLVKGVQTTRFEGLATFDSQAEVLRAELRRHGYSESRRLDGELLYWFIKVRLFHSIEYKIERSATLSSILMSLRKLHDVTIATLISNSETSRIQVLRASRDREAQIITELKPRLKKALAEPSFDSTIDQILSIILEINHSVIIPMATLEFFWYLMSLCEVFVSDLEKYLVSTTLIYES